MAVELIKELAETENLTINQALGAFVAEAGLDLESASRVKAALYEGYTLKEMASDSMSRALFSVFVAEEKEEIQEMDTKETQEGTKYKVRVQDKASGSTYSRYATRAKIAELRANPNIASVELSDYGADEDKDGQKTASAKGGGRDRDGDGKVESSSKEHAGVVHNAIQRAKGGKPDGKDTRSEEVYYEEGPAYPAETEPQAKAQGLVRKGKMRAADRVKGVGINPGPKKSHTSGYNHQEEYQMTTWDKYLALREAKKQGYNDRLDDAEGAKHGKKKEQDEKDRRDESEAMEKKDGKRKYAGDHSMDESVQGYNDRLDDAEGAKHGKKKQSEKDRRDESEAMEKKDGKRKFSGDKSMDEAVSAKYFKQRKGMDSDEAKARKDDRIADAEREHGMSAKAKKESEKGEAETAKAAKYTYKEHKSGWQAYLELREAKKSKAEKEKAAKDGHAAALYKDQWKDRDIADYDKEHGKDERAKEMRADAGEDRKRMKELDPDWKHAKYATGEEKGKKNYKDKSKKKVAEGADMWKPEGTAGSDDKHAKIEARSKKKLPMPPKLKEDIVVEADLIDAGRQNSSERQRRKLDGKGPDGSKINNSDVVKLMPRIREEAVIVTEKEETKSEKKVAKMKKDKESGKRPGAGNPILNFSKDPECGPTSEDDEDTKKESIKLDDAGMPIIEASTNDANGAKADDVAPPADQKGERGWMNPKGKAKRPKGGDRRPNANGPDLPDQDGTVPTGAGV